MTRKILSQFTNGINEANGVHGLMQSNASVNGINGNTHLANGITINGLSGDHGLTEDTDHANEDTAVETPSFNCWRRPYRIISGLPSVATWRSALLLQQVQ